MIQYGKQIITAEDIDAVVAVLQKDFITQGPKVQQFEQAVAQYCTAAHAVSTSNATAALHLACLALGVKKGDSVWTSPISFVASANCALYCGAKVDFIDIDSKTFNISLSALQAKLQLAKEKNTLPKVIIVVHLGGLSCDMQAIAQLAGQYNIKIVEDASHAIGGWYQERVIGSCQYSDISVFSFHPVKIITTGEGGMALTNNKVLAARMTALRSHGITKESQDFMHSDVGPWHYEQQALGFNYRLTDIQAALGISQLARLDNYVDRRNSLAYSYEKQLKELPLHFQEYGTDYYSARHLFIVKLQRHCLRKSHAEIFQQLLDRKIGVNLHYSPIYRQPYYQQFSYHYKDFPNAEDYGQSAITLPLHPSLSDEQQQYIITTLKEIVC